MPEAFVTPKSLIWSRQRAGLTESDMALALNVDIERLRQWERGEVRPTFRQAQSWASKVHVPFGFLFLEKPPEDQLPIPDLRTIGGTIPSQPSLNLLDTVRDVLRRQVWYKEYFIENGGKPHTFIGKFSTKTPVLTVVNDIRNGLEFKENKAISSHEEYLRELISAAENLGVLVMRSGIVGNNTSRKLDVGEFRGFAISDKYAPVIFINSADAPSARLFTMMHELAHLWIGSSGISTVGIGQNQQEEVFCNKVAGEFLVPTSSLISIYDSNASLIENITKIITSFKVSKLVALRRLVDINVISPEQYRLAYLEELNHFASNAGSGGSFYRNSLVKNSRRFTKAILNEAFSGRVLLRDAANLLGVQPSKLKNYAETLG
jgi:Zn-dependent peptidase ImmA (M78 family)/transcriptional regulator with XRE-family HTH domain